MPILWVVHPHTYSHQRGFLLTWILLSSESSLAKLTSVNGIVEISSQSLLLLSNVCCSDRGVIYPTVCQNYKSSSYWSVLVVRTILRFSPVAKIFLRWGDFIFGVPVPNRMDTSLWEGEVSCGFQWKTLRDQSYSQKNTIGPQGSEPALVTTELIGIYVF